MAADTSDDAKKQARNQKRADRLMQDGENGPQLRLVAEESAGAKALGSKAQPLKTKDLIEKVAARTGGSKADAKRYVEATLEALGAAIAVNENLNLAPLGRLRVAKKQPPVLTLKLRLADGPRAAGLALADEDQDG